MERLLDPRDAEFLAEQPGCSPDIVRRLMAERRRIFQEYLRLLAGDFNRLISVGKFMVVFSAVDRQEFARRLWRQQVQFYLELCAVRVQLALIPWGWTSTDAHPLVAALGALRDQVVLLSAPETKALEQQPNALA